MSKMRVRQKSDPISFVQALVMYVGIVLSRTKSLYYNENILHIKAPFMQVARGVTRLSTLFQSLFPKLAFIQADKKKTPSFILSENYELYDHMPAPVMLCAFFINQWLSSLYRNLFEDNRR